MLHIIQRSKESCLEKLKLCSLLRYKEAMLLLVVNDIYFNISHYKLILNGPKKVNCYDDWSLDSLVAKKVIFFSLSLKINSGIVLFSL